MYKFIVTLLATAVVAAAPVAAAPAAATTVNFTPLVSSQLISRVNPYEESGFHFENSGTGRFLAMYNWGTPNLAYSADPTGGVLINNYGYTTTTVTKVDGSLFDFASVDLAHGFNDNIDYGFYGQVNNQFNTKDVLFTFTTGSGSTTQTISIDSTAGFQAFAFNKTGLISFSYLPLTTIGGYIQADNFVFDAAGAVPEPASWAMLIAGFGLAGAAMRRRRTAVAIA